MSGSDDHAYHAADPSTTAVSFYAGDREEPAHIHVERDVNAARFWLDSISFASSGCLRRNEIGGIQRLVEGHQAELLRSWDEFLTTRFPFVRAEDVTATEDTLAAELFDGRSIFAAGVVPTPRAWKARGTLELAIGGSRRRPSLASTRRGYQRREPSDRPSVRGKPAVAQAVVVSACIIPMMK